MSRLLGTWYMVANNCRIVSNEISNCVFACHPLKYAFYIQKVCVCSSKTKHRSNKDSKKNSSVENVCCCRVLNSEFSQTHPKMKSCSILNMYMCALFFLSKLIFLSLFVYFSGLNAGIDIGNTSYDACRSKGFLLMLGGSK